MFKDFTPIMLAATFPTVIMIHPSVPAKNVQEFVALVKSQPGKLTYSSAGTGNGSHLTVELFRAAAGGLDMVHVPYKGGAPAIQALLAGEVQLTAVSVNTALPHIQSGKVRALGVASPKRSPALPDVPTFIENGIVFEADSWLAIMGPAGIPADIAAKLNQEIAAALREPETQERLAKIGLVVVASTAGGLTERAAARRAQVGQGGQGLRRRRRIGGEKSWMERPRQSAECPKQPPRPAMIPTPGSISSSARSSFGATPPAAC